MAEHFPKECRYVLETLGTVYHHDAVAEQQGMSPAERLIYHQTHSGPLLEQLKIWAQTQLDDHPVEPNSGLAFGVAYLLRHWDKLTEFMRVPGAPLDNNFCEQALKRASRPNRPTCSIRINPGSGVSPPTTSPTVPRCRGNMYSPTQRGT